jgi:hypothetical protein
VRFTFLFAIAATRGVSLGLKELGYTEEMLQRFAQPEDKDEARSRADAQDMRALLESAKKHEAAWPFLEPVDTVEVDDYLDKIADPIDLRTMETKLDDGTYEHFRELKADLMRMFDNCRAYNGTGIFVKTAEALEKHVRHEIIRLDQARDARGAPRIEP